MFPLCLEQEQVLLQKYRFQEKEKYEITCNVAPKKVSNTKSRYSHINQRKGSQSSTIFRKKLELIVVSVVSVLGFVRPYQGLIIPHQSIVTPHSCISGPCKDLCNISNDDLNTHTSPTHIQLDQFIYLIFNITLYLQDHIRSTGLYRPPLKQLTMDTDSPQGLTDMIYISSMTYQLTMLIITLNNTSSHNFEL